MMKIALASVAVAAFLAVAVAALWPVVADAPWEDSAAPVVAPVVAPARQPSRCEMLTQQLADAQTELAALIIEELGSKFQPDAGPGDRFPCW